MSSGNHGAGTGANFSKYRYKPGSQKGGSGSATSSCKAANAKMSTAAASAKARPRRRIVEDSDDENEAEVNRLLQPPKRSDAETRPAVGGRAAHNGIASAGSRGAATTARKSVAVSDGGTSSGSEDTAWFKKPSSNAGVTVTAKRAKGMANPDAGGGSGWMSKNDPAKLTSAQWAKNVQRAKAQRQKPVRVNRGAPRTDNEGDGGVSKRRGGKGPTRGGATKKRAAAVESEESCDTGDDSEEEEEEEFEDDEESSDGDSEDDLELTDASEGDDVVVPAAKRGGARSTVGRDAKHGLKRSSAEKPAKRDSASKGVTAIMGKRDARRKGSANVMDVVEEVPAVRDNGGMKGVASRAPNGVKRESKSRGTEGGGVAKVKIVGVNTGSSRSLEIRGGAGVENGDASRERNNKKRRRIQESDDDSSGAEEVREVEKPPRKKKEVYRRAQGDDDIDDSDHGSDSEDGGARARKVLEECSVLSKKLASVISSWAVADDDGEGKGAGADSSGGALELTNLKAGGRAVTTNEEIAEACPGLKLKPYQLVGVNWMCLMRETGVNGVLADEMGLGKTVQTIAFFALLRHRRKGARPRRPHMVVVPSSVLDNWDSELKKFCPSLNTVKYHGSQKERAKMRQGLNAVSSGAAREGMPDIILTTYVIWERESSGEDRAFLKKFRYDYMILDEGHSIKNIKSSRFQRLRVVDARHRLLLSGTPVQNNLGELLALLSFLMPEIFRSDVIETLLEFLGEMERKADSSASVQVREVRGMLAPFVLRRLKSSVLKQLGAKTEALEKVPLSETQRSIYDGVLEKSVGAATTSAKDIKNIFTELRKAANHPLLLLNHFDSSGKIDEVVSVLHRSSYYGAEASRDMVAKEVRGYSDFDLHNICSEFDSLRHLCLPEGALFTSAKMERLKTLLPDLVGQGHRILLFSQWTRLLDLFEVLLRDSMGLKFCRLDGSTPVSERKALIDRFSSDPSIPVFLLSTRAGGLGINLTSADTVILHDVDFNPENDRQAEDRCHRIGQTKPVTVIKMVAEGTVDEEIYTMGERKKELNKSVLNDAASKDKDATSTISGILKRAIQIHMASSAEKPAKLDSASKGVTAMGKGDARRKGTANAMDVVEEAPAVRDNGGMKGVASRAPNGVKRESKSRGTKGGGVAKVKIVGVKTGSSRSLEVRGGAGVENGDASRERNNKKRRRIQESDDDSSGAEEVREVEKPPRKKKEVT